MHATGKKPSKQKIQNVRKKEKKINDRIIRDIWALFETEEQKE